MPYTGIMGYAIWFVMTGLALGVIYAAIAYRIHPGFLLPLAAGMILVNLPGAGVSAAFAPFLQTLQSLWRHGVYPPLILFCLGAGLDLSYLIAHPRQLFLGLLNPLALLAILALGRQLGLTFPQAGCGSLVAGGDGGVSAIFLSGHYGPELVGPIALTAALLVGLLPRLQPVLAGLLTTRRERMIRMAPTRKVAKRENLVFAAAGLVLTSLLTPRAMVLTGMFFLGNLLRESGVVERLARTLSNRLGDILLALLGLAVGAQCRWDLLISLNLVKIVVMGLASALLLTLAGIAAIKVVNLFSRQPANPLVGAAALGLLPHAAQVVQIMGRREDPHNNLYAHALASSQASLLAATLTAGVLWGILGGV